MSGVIKHIVVGSRCPFCRTENAVYIYTDIVPQQNRRFEFNCSNCAADVTDYVGAVAVPDNVPDDGVQGRFAEKD